MDLKMIVFDIDGTLIKRGKMNIEPSAVEAIELCIKKGVETLIATGRGYYYIQEHIINTFKHGSYVTINGSCTVEEGRVIDSVPISALIIDKLLASCERHDIALGFKFDDSVRVYRDYDKLVAVYCEGRDLSKVLFDNTSKRDYHIKHGLPLGVLLIGEENDMDKVAQEVPEINFVYGFKNFYDGYLQGVSKAEAILKLLRKKGLTWENCIAFGDSPNDRELLKAAGIGVAMGNADEGTKAFADYVTTSIDDDGIYNALKALKII